MIKGHWQGVNMFWNTGPGGLWKPEIWGRPKVNTKPKGMPKRGNGRARSLKHERVWRDTPETNRGPHDSSKVTKGNRKMRSPDVRSTKPRKELDFTRRI